MILPGTDPAAIAAAAHALRTGALVGLPTETVYGLAADADDPAAVAQIFARKGRPSDHPLIVHVADSARAAAVAHFASEVPPFAQALMDAFWPGPLTLILPRRAGVATAAAGGQASVGQRCPAHPVAQAVLQACAAPPEAGKDERRVFGLAAPSANRFGRVSPTTAAHVQAEFGEELLVLDGGPCAVGIESTIIDGTRGRPVLLRPGAITRAQIAAACGLAPLSKEDLPMQTPRASGTLEAHYAPTAKVRLMDARALQTALDLLGACRTLGVDSENVPQRGQFLPDSPPHSAAMGQEGGKKWAAAAHSQPTIPKSDRLLGADAARLGVYARTPLRCAAPQVVLRRMPEDAAAAAQELFAALRAFDAAGVALLWIETPPDTPAWEGVRDRLQRAAAA